MNKSTNTADYLRQKIKVKHLATKKHFADKYSDIDKYIQSKGDDLGKIRQKSAKLVGAGALAGTLMMSPGSDIPKHAPQVNKKIVYAQEHAAKEKAPRSFQEKIASLLPDKIRPLSPDEEKSLENVIKKELKIDAKAALEGEHLNTTFGKIGAEQHLLRYPGDTNSQHAPGESDYGGDRPRAILKEGIAPGKGAWGYFAPSKSAMTKETEDTERWYSVAQTLYLPDWGKRQPHLRDWYKYRKILIVNTDNGKAVVTALADAGPAAWTGKHFGGSPEVMDYLGGPRYKKGPVLFFFVDDPDNKIPLGPVQY